MGNISVTWHYEVEDSFLEGLDDHNIEVIFRDTIKASVQYAVLTRCGLDASLYIDADDLRGITNFNNVGTWPAWALPPPKPTAPF